jgi:hypothetical protein
MADFKVHLLSASAISGLVATSFFAAGIVSSQDVLLYSAMGTIGGILPDLDSDHSVPTQILFNFLGIAFAFLAMLTQIRKYSIAELLLIWLCIYIGIRYLAYKLFAKFTVHRGIIHSIPAGVLFWFATTALCSRVLHFTHFASWMSGFFVFIGYLIHLIFDEIYSVDLSHAEMKRSFGSAVKVASLQNMRSTLIVYLLIIAMFLMTPSPKPFYNTVFDVDLYKGIQKRLLPKEKWFKGLWNHSQN